MKHDDSTQSRLHFDEKNRVPGFDPMRFVRMGANGPRLDLATKKVWFKLKHPDGRILLRSLEASAESAQVEAKLFLSKSDTAPIYFANVRKVLGDVPANMLIQAAQHDAIEQILDAAGFTVKVGTAAVASEPIEETVTKSDSPVQAVENTKPIQKSVDKAQTLENTADTPAPIAKADENPKSSATSLEVLASLANKVEQSEPIAKVKPSDKKAEILDEIAPATEAENVPPYTKSTPVEEILAKVTLQEALDHVISSGPCIGWTVAQAMTRKSNSLRFFASSAYAGDDNILRASAKLVLERMDKIIGGDTRIAG